jgi:thiol:disulfide interchange protein
LVYRMSSRTTRATQRNPVSKNQKKKKKKKDQKKGGNKTNKQENNRQIRNQVYLCKPLKQSQTESKLRTGVVDLGFAAGLLLAFLIGPGVLSL